MFDRIAKRHAGNIPAAALAMAVFAASPAAVRADSADGIVQIKSAYPMAHTIELLKKDISAKGIMFFSEIDQSRLAANAGVQLSPSTLLVFGNPPLGTLFLTSNPNSGLDWPVRMLVRQDPRGDVWVVYTDFAWIARRHKISDRAAAFKMASEVVASITSNVAKP